MPLMSSRVGQSKRSATDPDIDVALKELLTPAPKVHTARSGLLKPGTSGKDGDSDAMSLHSMRVSVLSRKRGMTPTHRDTVSSSAASVRSSRSSFSTTSRATTTASALSPTRQKHPDLPPLGPWPDAKLTPALSGPRTPSPSASPIPHGPIIETTDTEHELHEEEQSTTPSAPFSKTLVKHIIPPNSPRDRRSFASHTTNSSAASLRPKSSTTSMRSQSSVHSHTSVRLHASMVRKSTASLRPPPAAARPISSLEPVSPSLLSQPSRTQPLRVQLIAPNSTQGLSQLAVSPPLRQDVPVSSEHRHSTSPSSLCPSACPQVPENPPNAPKPVQGHSHCIPYPSLPQVILALVGLQQDHFPSSLAPPFSSGTPENALEAPRCVQDHPQRIFIPPLHQTTPAFPGEHQITPLASLDHPFDQCTPENVSELLKPSRTRSHASDSCTASLASQTQPGERFSESYCPQNAPSRLRHQENAEKSPKSPPVPPSPSAFPTRAPSLFAASVDCLRPLDDLLIMSSSPLASENAPDSSKVPFVAYTGARDPSERIHFMFRCVSQPTHPGNSTQVTQSAI